MNIRQEYTKTTLDAVRKMESMAFLRKTVIYLFLGLLTVITLTPLLWAVSASFTPLDKIFKYTYPFSLRAFIPQEFTLEAYANLFHAGLANAIKNSLIMGLSSVFFGGAISAMAGFAFGRFNFPGKGIIFSIVLFTAMIPPDIIAIPTYVLVRKLGWYNTYQGLIVPSLAHGLAIFLFAQFFKGFPQELIDAARVEGSSWMRIFVSLILPNSKPVVLSASLILFIFQWSQFLWPLIVAPTPELQVIQIAIAGAQDEYRTYWNELLGGALIAALFPIFLILPFQKYYVRGISGTGMKA